MVASTQARTRKNTGGNARAGRLSLAFPYRCCRGSEHAVRGAAPRTHAKKYPRFLRSQTVRGKKSQDHPQFVTQTSSAPRPRPTRHPATADSASGGALPATDNPAPTTLRAEPVPRRRPDPGRQVPVAFVVATRRTRAAPRRPTRGVCGKAGLRGDPANRPAWSPRRRAPRPASSSRSIGPDRCTGTCGSSTMASSRRGRCRRASRPIPRRNHLAVHTEDHPLEYLDFAGEIPAGQYGAGSMTVWDSGTYECHKFEPREVQVTLHGKRARGRYVLFQTKGDDWMIHRMDPPEDAGRELPPEGLRPMSATLGDAQAVRRRLGVGVEVGRHPCAHVRRRRRASASSRATATRSRHRYPELRPLGVELGHARCRARRRDRRVRRSRTTQLRAAAATHARRERDRRSGASRRRCPSCT